MRSKLGIFLICFAVMFLLFIIVFPALIEFKEGSLFYSVYETLACGTNNENLEITREVGTSSDGGTSFTAHFHCFDNKTERWVDETGKMFLIGGGGFTLLLIVGIVLTIQASHSWMNQMHKPVQTIPPHQQFSHHGYEAGNFTQSPNPQISLKDRLNQLDDARAINLITTEEYEQMRQEIIANFSE